MNTNLRVIATDIASILITCFLCMIVLGMVYSGDDLSFMVKNFFIFGIGIYLCTLVLRYGAYKVIGSISPVIGNFFLDKCLIAIFLFGYIYLNLSATPGDGFTQGIVILLALVFLVPFLLVRFLLVGIPIMSQSLQRTPRVTKPIALSVLIGLVLLVSIWYLV